MNKWIYAGISFTVGVIVGGISTYLIGERKASDEISKYQEELRWLDEDRFNCKADLEDAIFEANQLFDAVRIFCDENTKDNILDLVNTRLNVRMMQKQGLSEEEITDCTIRRRFRDLVNQYGHLSDAVDILETKAEEYARVAEELHVGLMDGFENGNPEFEEEVSDFAKQKLSTYVISEDEYVRTADEYDQEVLTYYALDDTLADEDDDIVHQSTVGEENLMEFERSEEPAIFVRDERNMIEYEIIWEDKDTYQSIVLGVSNALRNQRIFRKKDE